MTEITVTGQIEESWGNKRVVLGTKTAVHHDGVSIESFNRYFTLFRIGPACM